jgi:hypothetical protein
MKTRILKICLLLLSSTLLITACRKRDTLTADNYINFEYSQLGIAANEASLIVTLKLSSSVSENTPVVLKLNEEGITYGNEYTMTTAPVNGEMNLIVPSGNNEVKFTINKVSGAFFNGDEKLNFEIFSTGSPVVIGVNRSLTVSFSELLAANPTAIINGGGSTYGNKVFIDISANRQTPVLRTSWDLGFYTGSDFRVILNASNGMMAKQIDKNDLTQVTAADTVGMIYDVAMSQMNPQPNQMDYIDYPDGDLTRTAIASIDANDANNKVYIVNRGTGVGSPAPALGWKKIRILRSGNGGYILQHADIASTTFQTVQINKDAAYFFNYVSFETGVVSVEPQKTKWDFAWSYSTNVTNFGFGEVPYMYQDFILINRNVEVAKVMTSTIAYDEFTSANIASIPATDWSSKQNAIGADWRSGGGPGVSPAVRTDRFYIFKDGDNNYYKLRFTGLTENGERGYPSYEATLLN